MGPLMHANTNPDRPSSSLLYRLISGDDTEPVTTAVVPATVARTGGASQSIRTTRRQHAKLMSTLRWQIEQDLMALFGTRRMSCDTDLNAWPMVRRSVLNYGIPDLSGSTGSSIDTRRLQRELVDAIKCYEPRLKPETLTVTCQVREHTNEGVLVQIEAMFGPADALESFALGLSICLGSGQCRKIPARQAA
tara:strand:+ start:26630 stop:27205 length:576 start_codon:yes stop_codon:yes gene_type:complete